jgi:SAM-dependent methyltransferase
MSQFNFYRQFEDRHRGPRELIKRRLTVYLPFLRPIREFYPEIGALDLGCGRCEWLELLNEHGFQAKGVDTDAGMLAACPDQRLDVEQQEAITYLLTLTEHSLSVVSGFHIAEHLPFQQLRIMVAEALRVLQPGGLLILETPNPENLVVGSSDFYLDPTHQRPIPAPLLTFLAEYVGFQRVKVLRLHEDPSILTNLLSLGLYCVLNGVSPDYAIVAQKEGPPELMLALDGLFEQPFGLSLGELAAKYDQEIQQHITGMRTAVHKLMEQDTLNAHKIQAMHDQLNEAQRQTQTQTQEQRITQRSRRLAETERRVHTQELRVVAVETRLNEWQQQWSDINADRERWRQQVEAWQAGESQRYNELEQQLRATTRQAYDWYDQILRLQQSLSWRVTAPLRLLRRVTLASVRGMRRWFRYLGLAILFIICVPLLPILLISVPFVLRCPGLRNRIGQRIKRYPALRSGLRLLAYKLGRPQF